MVHDRDPRLEPLARRLREQGRPPERDLWPGIEEAIDRRERAGKRSVRTGWWRLAAAAAALVVLVLGARDLRLPGAGDVGGSGRRPVLAEAPAAREPDSKAAIDRALDELNEALAADPDNPHLTRLALMVHRSRGEMLRRGPDPSLRTG